MRRKKPPAASPLWETLETYARGEIQGFLQRVLEEEVEALLGRKKSERRRREAVGYRNGHGRPRQLALTSGTITVRRPRVRDLDERPGEGKTAVFLTDAPFPFDLITRVDIHISEIGLSPRPTPRRGLRDGSPWPAPTGSSTWSTFRTAPPPCSARPRCPRGSTAPFG